MERLFLETLWRTTDDAICSTWAAVTWSALLTIRHLLNACMQPLSSIYSCHCCQWSFESFRTVLLYIFLYVFFFLPLSASLYPSFVSGFLKSNRKSLLYWIAFLLFSFPPLLFLYFLAYFFPSRQTAVLFYKLSAIY